MRSVNPPPPHFPSPSPLPYLMSLVLGLFVAQFCSLQRAARLWTLGKKGNKSKISFYIGWCNHIGTFWAKTTYCGLAMIGHDWTGFITHGFAKHLLENKIQVRIKNLQLVELRKISMKKRQFHTNRLDWILLTNLKGDFTARRMCKLWCSPPNFTVYRPIRCE